MEPVLVISHEWMHVLPFTAQTAIENIFLDHVGGIINWLPLSVLQTAQPDLASAQTKSTHKYYFEWTIIHTFFLVCHCWLHKRNFTRFRTLQLGWILRVQRTVRATTVLHSVQRLPVHIRNTSQNVFLLSCFIFSFHPKYMPDLTR